ncbi:hypothetical protein [Defluviitalea phaphyphila]|uniref:hypothetical protein n=1 Tax=Defluviitalea phaphyphila TaxID=1473580 RepID=UPI000A759AED|nr:hypothetical protein [Defluviitalea phaphyphila]
MIFLGIDLGTSSVKIIAVDNPKEENIKEYNKIYKLYQEAYRFLKNWFKLKINI